MRLLSLAVAAALLITACTASASHEDGDDVYAVSLQGTATTEGVLVLSAPQRIDVDVAAGDSALDVALALREGLTSRGHEVICIVDQGVQGFSLLVRGEVEIANEKSNLGGIGGSSAQVIQRPEVIKSTVREYLRFLRENDEPGLRAVATDDFLDAAADGLGQGISLVQVGQPSIGCHTASVVVEIELPGGSHRQREFQLVSNGDLTWRVDGIQRLADWEE